MHVLLTRPLEDCHNMILRFKNLGHLVSHLPLLNIEPIKYHPVNFSEFKSIIFTSANAIKFLDTKNIDKNTLCFCVGNSTEKKAKSVGFQNIFTAGGNASNLKELILKNFEPSDGKIIYFSGEILSTELDKDLELTGYKLKRVINYKTILAPYSYSFFF